MRTRVLRPVTALFDELGRRVVLTLVLGELVVLWAPTVRWLFDRWTMSVWHHIHGLFIPPLVAYFVYRELRRLHPLPPQSSAWGFAIFIPALALHALDAGIHTQILSAASLVLAAPGLSLLFLGGQTTKQILFPLAFLAFMLPIPSGVIEPGLLWLRMVATDTAATIVALLGIPVFAERTTLHVPNAILEVSDACSGFSTLYAALALACLVAYGSADTRRRVVVLLLAVPFAIAANILRVTLLVLLVWWQGRPVLDTGLHAFSGLLSFALVVFALTWLGHSPHPTLERRP